MQPTDLYFISDTIFPSEDISLQQPELKLFLLGNLIDDHIQKYST